MAVKLTYLLSVILFLYFPVNQCGVIEKDFYRLDIIHYNDFHDRMEETSVLYPVCNTNNTECVGGFARLYKEIKTLLKEKPKALLLNAGDNYQGTYWYTLLKWKLLQKLLNMLPHDAYTLGNHEFDDGVKGLTPFLAGLQAPVVAANLDVSEEPTLGELLKSHVILERGGRKIGIFGLVTQETALSSNPDRVLFLDPIKSAENEAELLTEKGVDIIILLSHCGLSIDKQIAEKVGENIDIIIGGHSHSLLWNGTAPSEEVVSGPYPIIIHPTSKPKHKVLIATASAYTKYLGNITTYFDIAGELQNFEGNAIFLNRSIPEDPEIKELLQPYADDLHKIVSQEIGVAEDDFDDTPCLSKECAIGNLVADAYLDATNKLNVSSLPQVSFIFRNIIRAPIAKGVITRGMIINALPFSNRVMTIVLPGRNLLKIFKKCFSFNRGKKPFQSPWMPQVAGLRLILNPSKEEVLVFVQHEDGYRPLQLDEDYQVTSVDFLIRDEYGSEVMKLLNQFLNSRKFEDLRKYIKPTVVVKKWIEIEMLQKHDRRPIYIGKDSEVVIEYIKTMKPLKVTLDNRITVLK